MATHNDDPNALSARLKTTEKRIADQRARITRLTPGSDEHRVATNVLLLIIDSLHVMRETDQMLQSLRKIRPNCSQPAQPALRKTA